MGFPKIWLGLLPAFALAAVPAVQNVTDSASYGPRVAPGSLAVLFGSGLATDPTSASGLPLTTSLGGTTVSVAGTLAPLLYVSPRQINFQVPSSTKSGNVNVVVNGPGGASAAFTFTVAAQAPSIYQYGSNHTVAQNSDGTLNSPDAPAASGSVIAVYLTGQGALDHAVTDGTATPLSPLSTAKATATATIGPQNAPVKFLGLTPGLAGLGQANIQVPTLPTGDYPLVITVGGFVSASAIVSVSGSGTYTNLVNLVGTAPFANSDTSSVVAYNNVAYVCGEDRITMVDVTDPAAPVVFGEFGDNVLNGGGDFCVTNLSASTPYLTAVFEASNGMQSFAVYSLANPKVPSLLAVASTPYAHMENLSFSGVFGFVTTSYITYTNGSAQLQSQTGDFLVFDFTNPARPLFLTSLQNTGVPGSGNQHQKPWSQVVAQAWAYVASSTATGASPAGTGVLDVFSVGSPSAPTPISEVSVPQAAMLMSFDVSGNTLLAAGNTSNQRNPGLPDFDFTGFLTLTAMDITNVQLPTVVSTITTQIQANGTFNVAGFTNGVFAIVNKPPATDNTGPASLMLVDARTPSNILLYPFQTQFGFSGILATNTGYLFAPTALGLNIYKLQ